MAGQRLCVCLIPGTDLRRVNAVNTPFLDDMRRRFASAEITTLPSAELLSTLITGRLPHEHGFWQVARRPVIRRSLAERLVDTLPDALTVFGQCLRHQLTKRCDVPTIPPHRRREFEFFRMKFHGRASTADLQRQLRGAPSLVDAVGSRGFRFTFTDRFDDQAALLRTVADGSVAVDLLQFHALDNTGHWFIRTDDQVRRYYGAVDRFARQLYERCQRNGVTLILLSDHGQEPVRETVDMISRIRGLDAPVNEYAYFLQPSLLRFWFHTPRAREAVVRMLSGIPQGRVLAAGDYAAYGIVFSDTSYGEVYFQAEPGVLFFPHDFYHPLVNTVFGMKNWQQRARIGHPWQVGYHGYLPENASERGFIIVLDPRCAVVSPRIHLTEVAPSILSLGGHEIPSTMRARPVFTRP